MPQKNSIFAKLDSDEVFCGRLFVASFIFEFEGTPFRPPIHLMAKVKTALKGSAF